MKVDFLPNDAKRQPQAVMGGRFLRSFAAQVVARAPALSRSGI